MRLSRTTLNVGAMIRFSAIGLSATIIVLAGFALAAAAPSTPPSGPVDPHPGISIANLSDRAFLAQTMFLVDDPVFYVQAAESRDSTAGESGGMVKMPGRAFMQSFLIPGWGQWYNGSHTKAFVFLGVEAAGWIGTTYFHSQGNKKTDQFQAFADNPTQGWDYQRYLQGLRAVYRDSLGHPLASDTIPFKNPAWDSCGFDCDSRTPFLLTFSHHIRTDANGNPIKNQTYYENTGKYDQFAFGWRDFKDGQTITGPQDTVGVSFLTPNREDYLHQRARANTEFSRARTILILTLANHLVSAVEAAIGASHINSSAKEFGSIGAHMQLEQSSIDGKLYPRMTMGYRF